MHEYALNDDPVKIMIPAFSDNPACTENLMGFTYGEGNVLGQNYGSC